MALVLGLTACSQEKAPEPTTTQTAQQAAPPSPGTAATQPTLVSGKVLETMDASGYSYLHVQTAAGDKWIAVNQTKVDVGEEITYMDSMVMQNFFSKTLDRTFPEIVFSSGLVGKTGAPPSMPPPGTATQAQGSFSQALSSEGGTGAAPAGSVITGSKKAVVPFAEIKVEKAPGENSYSIEEIFSKAEELNGKTVAVRGKIMKVSPRIMGRNWIHLQDGTGNPSENTHDLVVTTDLETEADWDIITMEGVLTANKDFGSGYSYKVIIEGATLKK
jgi:hypothetical protein